MVSTPYIGTLQRRPGYAATLLETASVVPERLSASGVYHKGSPEFRQTDAKILPTLVLGYERPVSSKAHLLVQGYVSPSIFSREDTDLHELLATKYQLSIGFYHRLGSGAFSFAVTEILQNFDNTPDVGFQLGWAYSEALFPRRLSINSPRSPPLR
jgi:hypothetical protein